MDNCRECCHHEHKNAQARVLAVLYSAHLLLAARIALTPHTGCLSSPTRNVTSQSSGMADRVLKSFASLSLLMYWSPLYTPVSSIGFDESVWTGESRGEPGVVRPDEGERCPFRFRENFFGFFLTETVERDEVERDLGEGLASPPLPVWVELVATVAGILEVLL